ncbi:His Kinase A (phospho-acceptor) domain-containing protein [Pseudarcicella hirudinis]|uniref:histidine kinase n=1 Tax=Pseudarcicella hirudinis TaxID=1079859 RepID=A0A1I5XDX7_9BACT|nr:sensor histidine kinase [Pseudarcicella hirudinis]SFQ30185.1 His Kinase A (phospho-acceptor) domain-containing protein [Pseudarcicella hirudinis]
MKYNLFFLRFSFIISAILMLAMAISSYNRLKQLIDNANLVDHTHIVLLTSEELLSTVKDVETGQRGYLLTHRENFLEPFHSGIKNVGIVLGNLGNLTADNLHSRPRFALIKDLTYRKIYLMRENIRQDSTGKISPQTRLGNLIRSKATMDSLRIVVKDFQNDENSLLQKRLQEKGASEEATPFYLLILTLFTLLLLSVSFVLINKELLRRVAFQAELEQQVEALNRSNAELEQFAYVASHDLQEPLRKIRAFSDRLVYKHKENLNEDGRSILDKISVSAGRMQNLIDDLLMFSRLVNKKSEMVEVNLNELLNNILGDLSEMIKSTKAEITIDSLPIINGYSFQLQQLFQNLLSNSLKFIKPDQVPQIKISYHKVSGNEIDGVMSSMIDASFHKFEITDNGIGFEKEYAEKIFVIFQRLHGRHEYGGTGIGLAICKRVVSNHLGYIFADSKLNEGTTFIVYLPVESA